MRSTTTSQSHTHVNTLVHPFRGRTCATPSTKHDTRLFPHVLRRIRQLLVSTLTRCPLCVWPYIFVTDVRLSSGSFSSPSHLRVALVEHELDDAGILESFPRKPIALLGIRGTETTTTQLVTGIAAGSGAGSLRSGGTVSGIGLFLIFLFISLPFPPSPFLVLYRSFLGLDCCARTTASHEEDGKSIPMEVASIEEILDPIKPVFPMIRNILRDFQKHPKIELTLPRKF